VLGKAIYSSVMPREIRILLPRSQEYFRRTREASLGHRLEDLLINHSSRLKGPSNKEISVAWPGTEHKRTVRIVRPYQVANSAQNLTNTPGYREVYEACLPYMEKKN
jgi:hypothetical protein